MATFRLWPVLIILSALFTAPANSGDTPSPRALALIEELGLRAANKPMAEHPGWRPQKVVVILRSRSSAPADSAEQALKEAAGDVELVFIRPGGKKLSPEVLVGVDAIIGMCTAALLKQADASLRWIHNYSVGMDFCTGHSETQRQEIVFTNNKRLSGPAIAEHTIAMFSP